jgi:SAM-dependent methyltransferase
MAEDQERERLGTTFELAAELYQDARPDYPEVLFDRLLRLTEMRPGDRVLEVGAGPGKATLPLLRRGLRVTAIEPGAALAGRARANVAGHPAEVVQVRFEDWPGPWGVFDLVAAATAWHWVDPERRYQLAAGALRRRVPVAPDLGELGEPGLGRGDGRGGVDGLEAGGDRAPVLLGARSPAARSR